MPLLFNGYQEPDTDLEIDPRKPHSNLPPGQRPLQLNGTKRFLNANEESTDEDAPGENESNASELDEDTLVFCRHLALHYCRQSLENPRHVPQASDLSALRRQSKDLIEEALSCPQKMSRAFHFVCAGDFGVFLRHCFNQMRRDLSPATNTAELSLLARRVFLVDTGCHNMALRLAIWGKAGSREAEHEVSVYDPNATDHHVQAFLPSLHGFTAFPSDHHFFSYIEPQSVAQSTSAEAIGLNYFDPDHNKAHQMVFYELRGANANDELGQLETDWSGSARVSHYLAASINCTRTADECLIGCLDQACRDEDPTLLKEVPAFSDALLTNIMATAEPEAMRLWRLVWETADESEKVHLLCGYSQKMSPLAFVNERIEPNRLAEWVAMLDTLSPQGVLRVLGATDKLGRNALQLALVSPEVLGKLSEVLYRCAESHATEIAQLLAQTDSNGCTALASIPPEQCAKSLNTWTFWLSKWANPEDLPALLSALDANKTPALAHAIKARADEWIEQWLRALGYLTSPQRHELLAPQIASGKPILQHLFQHQNAAALNTWFNALRSYLKQTDVAAALQQTSSRGLPALTEYLISGVPLDTSFDNAWWEAIHQLTVEERVQILQALDQRGCPAIVHAIRTGNPLGVRIWGHWLKAIPKEREYELLPGRDAHGASLLAQPWYAPDDSDEDKATGVVATHPSGLPAPVKEALGAWFDLCEALPAETRANLMAGCDADDDAWWIAMTYRGDSHLIADVVSEMNTRIAGDLRQQVVERLGAVSQGVPELLRQEMAEQRAPREQMAEALKAIGDWLPASLRAELEAILAES